MPPLNARNINLQTLVRTALQNRELAPGVARQIDLFRNAIPSATEKRLLAILDDAIAAGFITTIEPADTRTNLRPALRQSSLARLISI